MSANSARSLLQRPGGSWVAYVGPFRFPWGQAGSRRVYGVARSIAAAGGRVVVAAGAEAPSATQVLERDGDGTVSWCGVGDGPRAGASFALKAYGLFVAHGARTVEWLESQPTRPSHVIIYGGHAPFTARLLAWCRRNHVRLLADVVEWYDPKQMTGGLLGPFHVSAKIALRWQYPRCDGIIAISRYLEDHYRRLGTAVIRIPPTLDVSGVVRRVGEDADSVRPVRLVYAGTPGRKDLLANIIQGIRSVDPEGRRVVLSVLGPSEEKVRQLLGGKPPPAVRVAGQLPQEAVGAAVAEADFSVLLRPPERYAQAGFPTKVAESLAAGTPMICNLTSDIGEFVREGREGLVCDDHSAGAFAACLRRAIATSPAQRAEMRTAARLMAERAFDFRAYSGAIGAFLAGLESRSGERGSES